MGLNARVVVIGGGVIGCAAALALARWGARVTLLERDAIASGASPAAAQGLVGLLPFYTCCIKARVEVAVLYRAPLLEDVSVVESDTVARPDSVREVAQVLRLLEASRAHRAAPPVTVSSTTMPSAATSRRRRETVDQILGPGTDAGQLSGGQRRIVELARALMAEPRFLLVDEPSAGLAPLVADDVYATLDRLRQGGMGIVLVEQDIPRALRIADYVYVIDLGSNRYDGPAAEFTDIHKMFWVRP